MTFTHRDCPIQHETFRQLEACDLEHEGLRPELSRIANALERIARRLETADLQPRTPSMMEQMLTMEVKVPRHQGVMYDVLSGIARDRLDLAAPWFRSSCVHRTRDGLGMCVECQGR